MIDEVVKKLHELNIASSSKEQIDAEALLCELNEQFLMLSEDFKLLPSDEQETAQNKNLFYSAQQTFHSAGTKLIKRIFDPSVPTDEPEQMQTDENKGEQNLAESNADSNAGAVGGMPLPVETTNASTEQSVASQSNVVPSAEQGAVGGVPPPVEPMNVPSSAIIQELPYKKHLYMLQPLFALRPIVHVTEAAINSLLSAIHDMQERCEDASIEHVHLTIIGYVHSLMDPTSQALWLWQIEERRPTLDDLIAFLLKRSNTIEPPEPSEMSAPSTSSDFGGAKKKKKNCPLCKADHYLYRCKDFLGFSVGRRRIFLDSNYMCHNCFSTAHTTGQCAIGPCKLCRTKHNSLLCPKSEQNN